MYQSTYNSSPLRTSLPIELKSFSTYFQYIVAQYRLIDLYCETYRLIAIENAFWNAPIVNPFYLLCLKHDTRIHHTRNFVDNIGYETV